MSDRLDEIFADFYAYDSEKEHISMPVARAKQVLQSYIDTKIIEAREAKDNAYWERDQLVAALSKLYPAWLGWHEGSWEDDWRTIIYIQLPTGQVSWHIHESEIPDFRHLDGAEYLGEWDGHTTEEKYKRLEALNHRKER